MERKKHGDMAGNDILEVFTEVNHLYGNTSMLSGSKRQDVAVDGFDVERLIWERNITTWEHRSSTELC